jgi:hypothetical protein
MSACNCDGKCNRVLGCVCGGVLSVSAMPWLSVTPYQEPSVTDWPFVTTTTTGGASVEPEPSRTVPKPHDDPRNPSPSPLAGSWQCPGCLTIYAYWVSKCECQKRKPVVTGATTLPLYGTFTGQSD